MPVPLIVWAGSALVGVVGARYYDNQKKQRVTAQVNNNVTTQQQKEVTTNSMVSYVAVATLAAFLASKKR